MCPQDKVGAVNPNLNVTEMAHSVIKTTEINYLNIKIAHKLNDYD